MPQIQKKICMTAIFSRDTSHISGFIKYYFIYLVNNEIITLYLFHNELDIFQLFEGH